MTFPRNSRLASVQRAEFVAVGITQIGEIDLAPCRALAPTGWILDARAAVGDTGVVCRRFSDPS
jgi:hypothetical protein